jgi:hypothetical protein
VVNCSGVSDPLLKSLTKVVDQWLFLKTGREKKIKAIVSSKRIGASFLMNEKDAA